MGLFSLWHNEGEKCEQDIIRDHVLISMEVNLYHFRNLHFRLIHSLLQINVQYSLQIVIVSVRSSQLRLLNQMINNLL